jgi:1-pyrroline-4-hydroxy-2-carboxylate deaminase
MKVDWKGIYPAATTQFRDDEALNLPATAKHLDQMIRAGVDGLIMLGTVGENTSLDPDEKNDVLRMAIETSAGRVPVLTGVAEYTTRQACRYAVAAEEAGVDGLMVLPAMVYKTCPRETLTHFRTVAKATSLPIMVYNNPVAYGTDITPEMFVELMDEETIVAIKESSEDPRRITDLRNLTGDRYVLFGGVDDLALEGLMLGAEGWVSGLVNAFPEESRRLWDLALAGQWAEAREIYRWYTPLLHLDTMPKLVQYIKLAVAECGLGSEKVRAPRLILDGAEREKILAIIRTGIETRPVGKQVE